MVGAARDDFLRRYATSPIHVPRLERLLAVYGDDEEGDGFSQRFITWDRASADGEAARIVAEILSAGDEGGHLTRLSDGAIRGAIRWMSDLTALTVAERAESLRRGLTEKHPEQVAALVGFLEAAESLDAARFRAMAGSMADRRPGMVEPAS